MGSEAEGSTESSRGGATASRIPEHLGRGGREENSSPRGQATAGPGSVNAREARGAAAGPRAGKAGWRRQAAQTLKGRAILCRAAPGRRRDLGARNAGRAQRGKLGTSKARERR